MWRQFPVLHIRVLPNISTGHAGRGSVGRPALSAPMLAQGASIKEVRELCWSSALVFEENSHSVLTLAFCFRTVKQGLLGRVGDMFVKDLEIALLVANNHMRHACVG